MSFVTSWLMRPEDDNTVKEILMDINIDFKPSSINRLLTSKQFYSMEFKNDDAIYTLNFTNYISDSRGKGKRSNNHLGEIKGYDYNKVASFFLQKYNIYGYMLVYKKTVDVEDIEYLDNMDIFPLDLLEISNHEIYVYCVTPVLFFHSSKNSQCVDCKKSIGIARLPCQHYVCSECILTLIEEHICQGCGKICNKRECVPILKYNVEDSKLLDLTYSDTKYTSLESLQLL